MNRYLIIPVIAFFINVVTMSYISAMDFRKPVIRSFLYMAGVFTAWIFLGWFFYLPVDDAVKIPLGKLSSLFWSFTGFSFFHFTRAFLEKKRDVTYYVFLAAACVSVTVTASTDLVISGYRQYPWGWRFGEGPLFDVFSLACVILPVLWSWGILLVAWHRTREPMRRTQLGIMAGGIIIALSTAVVLHYVVPRVFGMDTAVRYNSQASSILCLFIFYAIIRYRFLAPGVRDVAGELFATIGEGVVILSSEGRVLQMNPTAESILGLEGVDPAGVSIAGVIDNYDSAATYLSHQATAGPPGAKRPVLLNQSDIRVRGSSGGKILVISDISEITRMNEAIRGSEARLRMISENVSDAIWIFDLTSNSISYVSPSVSNILGWSPEEFMERTMEERIEKESLENAMAVLGEEIADDAERDPFRCRALELREKCVDGKYIETEIKVTFIRDRDGKPTAVLGVTRDITQRKRLERDLSESLSSLRVRTDILEKDLAMAQSIQKALLPDGPPECEGFRIGYRYPLEAVGGDYFNIMPLDEGGLSVFLGDVSGHGVPAALFLSLLKSESGRLLRDFALDPDRYMAALNEGLVGNLQSYFITAVYGIFRVNHAAGGTVLSLANAGHPPPVLQRGVDGSVDYLFVRGKVLGVLRNPGYRSQDISLNRGDRVFFYTDGLPEMMNARREILGFEGLLDVIKTSGRPNNLDRALEDIMEAVNLFREGTPLTDDTVVIGIEIV